MINPFLLNRRLLSATAAISLFGAFASCGSGGNETASAGKPVTKSQFVRQADRICEGGLKNREGMMQAKAREILQSPPSEQGLLVAEVLIPIYSEIFDHLQELSPPLKEQAPANKVLAGFDKALKEMEANPAQAVIADVFSKPSNAAVRYGLKSCDL